jgi:DNA-binding transcriptional MerR regulator
MYYSIGEVAEMLDVPTSTVRFWESKFDILKPAKNSKGNRRFTPDDIDNLKLIYNLIKEKGMTIEGARKRLKDSPAGLARDQEIVDRLLGVRAILQEIREELREGDGTVVYEDDDSPDVAVPVATAAAPAAAVKHKAAKSKPAPQPVPDELLEEMAPESDELPVQPAWEALPWPDVQSSADTPTRPVIIEQTLF